jgi:hypothetical protein
MKYAVIGGQYQSYFYGTFNTLEEAMTARNENEEFHDNHVGYVKPKIWDFEDCHPVNNFYGDGYEPNENAEPIQIDEDEEG